MPPTVPETGLEPYQALNLQQPVLPMRGACRANVREPLVSQPLRANQVMLLHCISRKFVGAVLWQKVGRVFQGLRHQEAYGTQAMRSSLTSQPRFCHIATFQCRLRQPSHHHKHAFGAPSLKLISFRSGRTSYPDGSMLSTYEPWAKASCSSFSDNRLGPCSPSSSSLKQSKNSRPPGFRTGASPTT